MPNDTSRAGAALAVALLLPFASSHAAGLNDTGQTQCYDAANNAVACSTAIAGNGGARPHQDGRYGRDPKAGATPALTKIGGGAAGFDFSCVLWNGTVINGANCRVGLVANTTGAPSGTPETDWACTKDNVTGLVWSLQVKAPTTWDIANSATFPDAGHNTPGRCGFSTGWRVPARRELFSITHYGAFNPAIDTAYFPATTATGYWTADTYAPAPTVYAWQVYCYDCTGYAIAKTSNSSVWLVRSGQ